MDERPSEFYVKRARELGILVEELRPSDPIVYGPYEPVGFRNTMQYVSRDNKRKMRLSIGFKGELDSQSGNTEIVGWSANNCEYSFSIILEAGPKYASRHFVVADGKITKTNKKSRIFAVGADCHPAIDRILQIYARYRQ